MFGRKRKLEKAVNGFRGNLAIHNTNLITACLLASMETLKERHNFTPEQLEEFGQDFIKTYPKYVEGVDTHVHSSKP